jgi:peptidoglycan/xylan/chitin deacetylase (PgdA/CDA1 family)
VSLTILYYHSVLPDSDAGSGSAFNAGMFGRQLDILKTFYRVLPLPEALERLARGRLPSRSVCITFDDGYADNCTVALPMLVERGMHATFFVTTGVLNGGIMWNDIVRESVRQAESPAVFKSYLGEAGSSAGDSEADVIAALEQRIKYEAPDQRLRLAEELAESFGTRVPGDLMMSSQQVRELADAGMEIGAHTVTHPILSRIHADQARQEIEESKRVLEKICGRTIDLFAYPNGVPGKDYSCEHIRMLKDVGFSAAVTTSSGAVSGNIDRFQLPRFAPWSISAGRFIFNHWRNSRQVPSVVTC